MRNANSLAALQLERSLRRRLEKEEDSSGTQWGGLRKATPPSGTRRRPHMTVTLKSKCDFLSVFLFFFFFAALDSFSAVHWSDDFQKKKKKTEKETVHANHSRTAPDSRLIINSAHTLWLASVRPSVWSGLVWSRLRCLLSKTNSPPKR